ncbi:benzoate 4-monooxygenase cytochrome P450 [Pseudovirgaria hyperparasitica]|uniref:Benzoate 4-monooxygenase cytochrome P450 n=1 Tax=Pseudovirgaria hyperparasitica TaxID=470096 RepID=A0A6A6VQY9_9PEZI|nr:benzoate 4-monooxygenase cytochrome P450 [Pseudovirgaria hyperparasitica]KAF2753078.1 benzoate 4-monooxygenase cytochrome P450 [Pseudovirgaria hyperparasitica]
MRQFRVNPQHVFEQVKPGRLALDLSVLFAICYVVQWALHTLYKSHRHPLKKFPGPRLAALSNVPYILWYMGGRQPHKLLALHRKYGAVVRTAPNELSFNSAQAWKDIYNFRPGHQTFIKSSFYEGGPFADQCGSIVSERDPIAHGKMRRYLSHAFSDASLSEQEHLISKTVDMLVDMTGKQGVHGFDIGKAFEMMTFDIIGDLAFGESFGGVESGNVHPWIAITLGALTQGALADAFSRMPTFARVFVLLFPGKMAKIVQDTKKNEGMALDLVRKRIAKRTTRKDFMTRILERHNSVEVSDVQLAAHSSDFIVAGSETTATALTCIFYYVLKNASVRQSLQREIRSTFDKYESITAQSTSKLRYLDAVIRESFRIFPPLPLGLPRVVPRGGDTVDGHFLPEGTIVSVNPLAASLDPSNFTDPLEYKPERWLGKNEIDVVEASQPFSLGARACIGRNLAWVELRTTLVKLHWKYDFELLNEEVDWQRDVRMRTLWNKPKLIVRAVARP